MNKPSSMSHKEWFVKRLSLSMVVAESIIDAVVTNQFDGGLAALKNNNTVEFSGLGKMVYKVDKAEKKLAGYMIQEQSIIDKLAEDCSPTIRKNLEKKLISARDNIKSIKEKI